MSTLHQAAAITLLACLVLAPAAGCGKKRKREPPIVTDYLGPISMVLTADPLSESQLIQGFYAVENDAWRWSARNFSVKLRPPRDAATKGARLILKFAVAGISIQKLKSLRLSASVNGLDLPPEIYTKPGEFTYARDVPATVLNGSAVTVAFTLDKALAPNQNEDRELGVIVSAAGLEPK